MPDADRPRELPARLLADPEMINACRVRDFARVFRLVKTRAGIYPSMIARRCDLTPSRVGEVITGQPQLQHMDVIERIADGLRIPGHVLGLARRGRETPQALLVTERRSTWVFHSIPAAPLDRVSWISDRQGLRHGSLREGCGSDAADPERQRGDEQRTALGIGSRPTVGCHRRCCGRLSLSATGRRL
ncbi:hypothetical protein GCM10023335_39100 [Streptomyces siamensis]|uniref:XRE family transcriptional regulator n=1 Tax=Streptomyces siamensis TaxID=1274986 RepID=A0ABP9IYZ9_9ACTN